MFFILLMIDIILYIASASLAFKGLYGLSAIALVLALISSYIIDQIYVKRRKQSALSDTEKGVVTGTALATGAVAADSIASNNKAKNQKGSDCDCSGLDCYLTDCGDCSGGADCGDCGSDMDCSGIDHPIGLLFIPIIALAMGVFYLFCLIFKKDAKDVKKKPFLSKGEKKAKKEQEKEGEVVDVDSTEVTDESSSDSDI